MSEHTTELPQQMTSREKKFIELSRRIDELDPDGILHLNRFVTYLLDSPGFSEAFRSFSETKGGQRNLEREDYERFMNEWEVRTV